MLQTSMLNKPFLPVGAVLFCGCGECARISAHGEAPQGWTVEIDSTAREFITALKPLCPQCNGNAYPYYWNWGAVPYMSETMQRRKNQPFRELARGQKNTALIEFMDGYQVVTSRNGYRRRKCNTPARN